MLRSLLKSDFKPKKQEFEVLGHMMAAINESYSNSLSIVMSVTDSSLLILVSCSMHLYNLNQVADKDCCLNKLTYYRPTSWQDLHCFLKDDHTEAKQEKGNFVFFMI